MRSCRTRARARQSAETRKTILETLSDELQAVDFPVNHARGLLRRRGRRIAGPMRTKIEGEYDEREKQREDTACCRPVAPVLI